LDYHGGIGFVRFSNIEGALMDAIVLSNEAPVVQRANPSAAWHLDGWLLFASLGLICFGIVMVTSSSLAVGQTNTGQPFYYAIRHLIGLGIGSVLALFAYRQSLDWFEKHSLNTLWIALGLLLLPFVPGLGARINGALRWIDLGVTNFQVVEASKILLIIYLAGYCVRQRNQLPDQWRGILKPLAMATLAAGLLLIQPDFGSATLILSVSFGLLWLAGARASYFTVIAVVGVVLLSCVAVLEPYRMQRLLGFLDPFSDPYKNGFQLTQALIAAGRGEWFGVGLGESVLKLFYLPEAHSDFIVAVIAEELGFVGLVAVCALFAVFSGRAFYLGLQAMQREKYFAGFLAYGIALMFSLQFLVSVGVNLGVLPTKGLTLPLISAGGSSVMMSVLALGLLFNVANVVRITPVPVNPNLGSAALSYRR
jgi:cell division protein FtsW